MDRGLYVIASGMLTELARQERIAHDLANSATPAYKAQHVAQNEFDELLLVSQRTKGPIGMASLGVTQVGLTIDFAQGALKRTDEQFDVGLDGEGFLVVATENGPRYTRNGQLRLDGERRLVTAAGLPVLGDDGKPIVVQGAGDLTITPDGTVIRDGKTAGKIHLVSLTNVSKESESLYRGTAGARPEGTAIRQGTLEGSNVEAAETMVEMISSLRSFEAGQRVIHAIDETLQRSIQMGGPSS
ncbi:MAG: flagellar hook-basal body protein [Gaiellales bacterium]